MPPSDQFAGSTYSFPSYIFDGQTGPASPVEYPVRRLDPVDLGSEDSEDEKSAFFVTPSHSIRHSPSSKSTSSQHQHLEVSVPDRLGSLSPLSECVEVREVPVKECEVAVEGDGEIDRVDSELSLLDDQYQESLINFSFSDWSAASNISQKSSHSRLLRSHQPLPSLQVRAATILLDPQLSPLNKTQFKPSEPDVIQFDQYELAEKVTIEVEAEVEDVGIKIAPSLKGPIINSIFWADSCDKWNDNSAVVNQAIADSNYDSNHRVVSPRSDRNCNSVTLAGCLGTVAPVEDSYSINMCAEDSGPDSMIQLNTEGSEMDIDADVLYQEACMYDRPLPQGPVTPLQMYSLMPVRADMLSTMTTYSQMDGCNPRILNLLEWAEYDAQTTLPAPPNSVVKEAQRNQRCVTGSKKWADAWHTGKAPVPQSDVSCMRYDKLPSALDTRNLSDPQAPIWNYIGPSMSSNTSSYPEDIISTTSSTAVCVRILTDKSSPRIGSCCHSDDDTICVDRKNNTYRESSRFKNDDVIGLSCVPLSQATFARALVTSLVTGFQSIATATVPPPMPSTCPDNTYQGYHPLDTYSTTLCGSRSTRELTAFSCHLVNTFRADVCTALEVYDLLLSELLSHALTSRSSGKYIESKADPFDLFRGDRLDTMTRNLNATRVLMVKVSMPCSTTTLVSLFCIDLFLICPHPSSFFLISPHHFPIPFTRTGQCISVPCYRQSGHDEEHSKFPRLLATPLSGTRVHRIALLLQNISDTNTERRTELLQFNRGQYERYRSLTF